MCFHSRREFEEWRQSMAQRAANELRAVAKNKVADRHAKSMERSALVVLRDAVGEMVAGWHCDPRDAQDVANTIGDLKSWHSGEFKYVDMSDVNKERARLNLPVLDNDGMPLMNRPEAAGLAPYSSAEERDRLVEEWDLRNRDALPIHQMKAIKNVVAIRKREAEEQAARETEMAQIAAEVGVKPADLRR